MDAMDRHALLRHEGSLAGSLIAAMPGMPDERFKRALVFICHHDRNGAMGLVVNKPVPDGDFDGLLQRFDCAPEDREILFRDRRIHLGGPVESGRGLLLHSDDYSEDQGTFAIGFGLGLTMTTTVLKAIVEGRGPRAFLFSLGYSGWGPGRLEGEILENSWLNCMMPREMIFDLLFDVACSNRYETALGGMGIAADQLSLQAGRC